MATPVTFVELIDTETRLEHTYRSFGLHEPRQVETHVDPIGWELWRREYLARRGEGLGHEAAIRHVESRIDVIEGRPDRWAPASPAPTPSPSPSTPLPAPGPSPGPAPIAGGPASSRLHVSGRWFATATGLFDYREVSAFALYSLWLQKRRWELDAFLEAMRPYATALRVLLTLDGDFWTGRGYRCAPDMPGFDDELRPFLAYAEARGFYVRLCLIGAIEPFGGVWHPDRRDDWGDAQQRRALAYVQRTAAIVRDAPNVLLEIANEPLQIGMRSSFDDIKALGRAARQVAPHVLMNFAAVDGPNEGDTSFVDAPADFADTHLHRIGEYRGGDGWDGWLWVKRSSEQPVLDNDRMPAISGEPKNFGSVGVGGAGDVERSPAVAFAYGATSRLRRYLTNFHFDDGLWCRPPAAETIACLDGWTRGLNAIPLGAGGGWCNGHHGCAPWRLEAFPTSDDVRDHRGPVRIFGRGGPGGYLGASIREPRDWAYTRMLKDGRRVEVIDRVAFGPWASAAYAEG
jgi:hypothetical protein